MNYPRLKIRRSHMTQNWYLVVMINKYDGQLITSGLTFNQVKRLLIDINRAIAVYNYGLKLQK